MSNPSSSPDLSRLTINRDTPSPGMKRAFRLTLGFGVAGLAVISALIDPEDPAAAARAFRKECE
jgi:hypothetical protein